MLKIQLRNETAEITKSGRREERKLQKMLEI